MTTKSKTPASVEPLVEVASLVEKISPDGQTDGSLEDLARRLAACDRIVELLGGIGAEINDALAERMETDQVPVEGVGVLVRTEKMSKRWIDERSRESMFDDARSALATEIARDRLTGEINPAIKGIVVETFNRVVDTFSIGEPKKAFRSLGLRPDAYKAETLSGYRVQIDAPQIEAAT